MSYLCSQLNRHGKVVKILLRRKDVPGKAEKYFQTQLSCAALLVNRYRKVMKILLEWVFCHNHG